MSYIALVTPVKDEIDNLPKLLQSIENQTKRIHLWLIIENDSEDGSKELLESVDKPHNVDYFEVINLTHEEKAYQLGKKYSSIIAHGFSHVKTNPSYSKIDFIGILDADCHPEPSYYEKLINYFSIDSALGIASGIIKYRDGTIEKSNDDHARGGCRLWRVECFKNSPYEIGLSADSTSSAKAIINGWSVRSFKDAVVFSRKSGSRYISKYPGLSAYYRHIPFYYVILKFFMLLFKGDFRKSMGYISGFINSFLSNHERLTDKRLIKHYRNIMFRKLK